MGSAIHDTIQTNTTQFTEVEKSIKVPSIRFSGRLDALINSNILVEIKSCNYVDYKKIIKTQQPRINDFYQTMTYKYILENHLNEAKNPGVETRTPTPSLDKYNIDTIQLIYIAHEIYSSDVEDFGLCLDIIKRLKKSLNSKNNQFFFMTSLILDMNNFDPKPYIDWIDNKIKKINYYVDNNKLPDANDQYVDRKKCFYCLYTDSCDVKSN